MGFLAPLLGVLGGLGGPASLAGEQATFTANQVEMNASNAKLNTQATKSAEDNNMQEFHVASEEAHNHVVRSYIDAVKQTT